MTPEAAATAIAKLERSIAQRSPKIDSALSNLEHCLEEGDWENGAYFASEVNDLVTRQNSELISLEALRTRAAAILRG